MAPPRTSSATTRWPAPTASGASAPTPASACPARPTAGCPTRSGSRAFAEELYEGNPAKIEDFGTWRSGDNLNTAIGQGDVLVTPLQLANGYATFANGGTLYRPQLVLQVAKYESRTVVCGHRAEAGPDDRHAAGLAGLAPRGAEGRHRQRHGGRHLRRVPAGPVRGRRQDRHGRGRPARPTTSLFAAFAPADAPTLVATAILPESGTGGAAAAPLIRRILEPLAASGGNLKLLPKAPLGGAFDVDMAVEEVSAPPSDNGD